MKSLILVLSTLILTSISIAQSRVSYLQDASAEFCPGLRFNKNSFTIYCKSENSQAVKDAKVGGPVSSEDLRKLKINLYTAVDAGFVPDADSNTVYFYTRWLENATGGKVGIITIEGWVNQEMGQSARFNVRYNLKGQVVMATEKSLR